jgi:hypothetical protein
MQTNWGLAHDYERSRHETQHRRPVLVELGVAKRCAPCHPVYRRHRPVLESRRGEYDKKQHGCFGASDDRLHVTGAACSASSITLNRSKKEQSIVVDPKSPGGKRLKALFFA